VASASAPSFGDGGGFGVGLSGITSIVKLSERG
jgi:hypothetical protein